MYHPVSLVRLPRQRKQRVFGVHFMVRRDNNRGLGKSNRWVEPCGSHLLSTENLFSLSSLAKVIISLLSKIHIFKLVSIVIAVELIISFNRAERNTGIFLLTWTTV